MKSTRMKTRLARVSLSVPGSAQRENIQLVPIELVPTESPCCSSPEEFYNPETNLIEKEDEHSRAAAFIRHAK